MAWPCYKIQGACSLLPIKACCKLYMASFPTSVVSKNYTVCPVIWPKWQSCLPHSLDPLQEFAQFLEVLARMLNPISLISAPKFINSHI